jgi:hypothetical protein
VPICAALWQQSSAGDNWRGLVESSWDEVGHGCIEQAKEDDDCEIMKEG